MRLGDKVRRKLEVPMWQTVLRVGTQQTMIAVGSTLAAFAYVLFQLPYNLAAGGVSGLGVIVNSYTGFSPGLFFLLANVPLFILGFFTLGRWSFIFSSILAVVSFSGATEFFTYNMPVVLGDFPITENTLLATIFAGLLYGVGAGIIYRYGGTIGGTSIPARIIYNKTGFPLSQSCLFTDLLIIVMAGIAFSWENALLAFLALLLSGMASDFVLEGSSQRRSLMIVTTSPEAIRYAMINELRTGVTMWKTEGGYSGTEKTMIYCSLLRSRIYDAKQIIYKLDPDAFLVVGITQQTWGGYSAPR